MIRKPTRIELKQEDDYAEYEEYKRRQAEQTKLNKIVEQNSSKLKNTPDKFLTDLGQMGRNQASGGKNHDINAGMNLFLNNGSRDLQTEISSNYLNSIFRTTNQPMAGNPNQDQISFDLGSDAITNNFIFSVLLNNISQNEGVNLGMMGNNMRGPNQGQGPAQQ